MARRKSSRSGGRTAHQRRFGAAARKCKGISSRSARNACVRRNM